MNDDNRLNELLNAWKEEKSLSRDRAQNIKDKITGGKVRSDEKHEEMCDDSILHNPTDDHRWWFKLYQESTVESINRVNATFDYGFKSA